MCRGNRASHQRWPKRRGSGRSTRRQNGRHLDRWHRPARLARRGRRRPARWIHRPCPWLANLGLVECGEPPGPIPDPSDGQLWSDWVARVYPPRTRANVAASDATIWLGSTQSRGYTTAHDAALEREPDHQFFVVFGGLTPPSVVRDWIATHRVRTLNIAGNRESTAPGIGVRVEAFLAEVFRGGRGGRRGR
jgi:hypothetical protein